MSCWKKRHLFGSFPKLSVKNLLCATLRSPTRIKIVAYINVDILQLIVLENVNSLESYERYNEQKPPFLLVATGFFHNFWTRWLILPIFELIIKFT
jgi:hypothetical protein